VQAAQWWHNARDAASFSDGARRPYVYTKRLYLALREGYAQNRPQFVLFLT
jgi:hypothetical protein